MRVLLVPSRRGAVMAAITAAIGLATCPPLAAQSSPTGAARKTVPVSSDDQLTGTLKKVRDSGVITVGYRASSVPFSYVGPNREPIGYSIEICKSIVDAIADTLGKTVRINWLPVTPDSRMAAITSGEADLECGSTTNNAERRKTVAFSPVIFVAGTKLMVTKGSPIRSFRDLDGKRLAVTAGTTNEKAVAQLATRLKLKIELLRGQDHAESYAMVVDGKADAFATDDVLLYGLIAENHAQDRMAVVGDFLSYEAYGIMFRKDDPRMTAIVQATLEEMATSRDLEYTYNHWFMRRLPSGQRINLPMSPQLSEIFQSMSSQTE